MEIQNFELIKSEEGYNDSQLLDSGIVLINNQMYLDGAVKTLADDSSVDQNDIDDLGFTLINVHRDREDLLALYKGNIDRAFIDDVISNKNLYTMNLMIGRIRVETVEHAYIRPQLIEDDIDFYVKTQFTNRQPTGYSFSFPQEPHKEPQGVNSII